ncbi:hypothetical protein A2331_03020 [Candidatus Falkowbacteria bacterium RIFOXYB2_FULL_34_18]|uniref:NodB homology domain-containing protein n=1 Tax=Candidatus Falkowbacteria bacterium RIFOXYD2_FULL_34_120 TaxID=1798007 RepID=A0A1F5TMG3_9BACT|nr:MAG: hypothetical protein A2331_03020 [Candidatus Falkowbacteria bacterium RIFOXYB2_FULL_34_18]OGF28320.1 MAG: hypothetical protein A2500_02920 [Candidatus Falkowbacteria bacterium RIFOXYC12_FULL_34_55]OGF37961.1 MAG: hypothetical protein A2466_06165 [Candidatus Falkowbacteria bacterium RIFOXYC2_FULL_34_220]OGF39679.1 MAG: hypothetical protein A2515_07460 [Candidatus Falkowbacteria bacterium RIFOXYD12_FULL_34_57]OGF40118.1 MAG: hypothetical protein A2531_05155 [Candidatus Falkowbacteria bact
MKIVLYKVLIFLKIHRLFQYVNRNTIIILMYHGFTDHDHRGVENYLGFHIPKSAFEKQLQYLQKDYNIISLKKAVDIIKNKKKIPKNSIVLTIDDGYNSNYSLAYPIIKKLRAPATIFLTTSFVDEQKFLWVDRLEYAINNTKEEKLNIDNNKYILSDTNTKLDCVRSIKSKLKKIKPGKRMVILEGIENELGAKLNSNNAPDIYRPLSWNKIKEMKQSGLVNFGSHTHTHPILSQCNKKQIKNELLFSKNLLEREIGIKCNDFAYPNGQPEDFSEEVVGCLKRINYKCALTTVAGKNNPDTNLYKLKRYPVSNRDDLVEFKIILSGISSFLNKIKNLI